MPRFPTAGITKLSELSIDADKDWQGKVISNSEAVIGDGKTIELEEALGTDHTATGIIADGLTAGENLAFPDLAYLKSDGKFWKADADAAATTDGILVIVLETINADATGKMLLYGFARDDTWNWTVGQWLYVSCTAGAITATKPSGAGDQVRKIGIAYSADIILFQPDSTIVEV